MLKRRNREDKFNGKKCLISLRSQGRRFIHKFSTHFDKLQIQIVLHPTESGQDFNIDSSSVQLSSFGERSAAQCPVILNIKVSEAAKRTKTLLQIDGALCTVTGAGRNKVSGYYIRFLSSQWSAGIDGDFLREHCPGLKFFYQIYQATTRIFHITLIKFDEQHRSRVNLLHRTRGRLPYY